MLHQRRNFLFKWTLPMMRLSEIYSVEQINLMKRERGKIRCFCAEDPEINIIHVCPTLELISSFFRENVIPVIVLDLIIWRVCMLSAWITYSCLFCKMTKGYGPHCYRWSFEDAVKYLQNYTAETDTKINLEVTRYIYYPGQVFPYVNALPFSANLYTCFFCFNLAHLIWVFSKIKSLAIMSVLLSYIAFGYSTPRSLST